MGARFESAQLLAPHRSKTHKLPLGSMEIVFVEPMVLPAGSLAQTSPARYGLGKELVGFGARLGADRDSGDFADMPVTAMAARTNKGIIRGFVISASGESLQQFDPGNQKVRRYPNPYGLRLMGVPAAGPTTARKVRLSLSFGVTKAYRWLIRRLIGGLSGACRGCGVPDASSCTRRASNQRRRL